MLHYGEIATGRRHFRRINFTDQDTVEKIQPYEHPLVTNMIGNQQFSAEKRAQYVMSVRGQLLTQPPLAECAVMPASGCQTRSVRAGRLGVLACDLLSEILSLDDISNEHNTIQGWYGWRDGTRRWKNKPARALLLELGRKSE